MKYLVALRERSLASLWGSQVLSSVGDELYMLAAMWIAVERFGSQAAYVAAAIGITEITFGLLGGLVADRFNRRWVMIVSDVVRFLQQFVAGCRGRRHIWRNWRCLDRHTFAQSLHVTSPGQLTWQDYFTAHDSAIGRLRPRTNRSRTAFHSLPSQYNYRLLRNSNVLNKYLRRNSLRSYTIVQSRICIFRHSSARITLAISCLK